MAERSLSYVVSATPQKHLLHVSLTIRGPLTEPLVLAMPSWTPGSYLVREYARHVENLRASSPQSEPVGVRKLAKDRWAIAHAGASEVTVEYDVYAHDLTVRTNHVDATHAYWNGAATYLRPVEDGVAWDALPAEVTVVSPNPDWHLATTLPSAPAREGDPRGTYRLRAQHFDELCDCPVDVGVHEVLPFRVNDKPHEIVLWGARARFDGDKLVRDVTAIVEKEGAFFEGLPYERYVFLLHLAPGSRGGLEHRTCTTLIASPDSFDTDSGYEDLLSLFAHEFFHLWHVKRTRPQGIIPYDYSRENYTRMLWLFEGGTSYYDWLTLRRAALVDARSYLKHLASEINRLEDTPGRFAQSVEESSFDAWVKLYRPDEHSVNSTVSYYLKGEVVCALLDVELRTRSKGEKSLDDLLRYLWREYGSKERGVPEDAPEALIAAATGVDVSDAVEALVRGRGALPYERVFGQAGLTLRARPGRGATIGVRLRSDHGRALLGSVLRDSPAEKAGLAPGDELIALDRRRVDDVSLRDRLRHRKAGDELEVLYARREEVLTTRVVLGDPPADGYEFSANPEASAEARAVGAGWLAPDAGSLWERAERSASK